MRVRIVFNLKNKGSWVPFHHQHLLNELIEQLISHNIPDYKGFKLYNFSGLKGQTKVSKQGLHFFSSKVTLVLASMSEEFIQKFTKALLSQIQIQIGQLLLQPESVDVEASPQLNEESKYICISPLVLVNPEYDVYYAKKFVSPEQDIFSDLLYETTMTRMEESGLYSSEDIADFYKFQLLPDTNYLRRIKQGEKKFARIYAAYDEYNQKHEMRAYTFPFTLYAAPEVQEFIFNCGLGAYTHRGFGMIDLANVDPVRRIKDRRQTLIDSDRTSEN